MAPAHLGAGLAGVLFRRACIHQQRAPAPGSPAHLVQRSGIGTERPVGKGGRGDPWVVHGDRVLLELPLGVAAIEDVDLRVIQGGE